ncbi:MAG: MFS transporter [Deltaproteobacteria bacterium]|nr:MFS transporter [Deltaproteobacteria bacterium]
MNHGALGLPVGGASSPLDRARAKAYLRLLPLLFVSFVVAYIDRANLAIAKLSMVKDLPTFDNAVFGLGGGLFFLGYVLLEVPGTLIVERWSARRWLGRIMVSWGVVAALQAFVKEPWQFYTVRFLLGLSEAGFMPGVIVYLSHWFPPRDRARATALFLMGTPVAQLINPKVSGWLLTLSDHGAGPLGLLGWQWVYVGWAIPAVILGVLVYRTLPDWPHQAPWLPSDELHALTAALDAGRAAQLERAGHMTVGAAFRNLRVLGTSLAYFFAITAFYGIDLFVPSILARWYHLPLSSLTWLLVIPAATSLLAQVLAGWSSDRFAERKWHAVVPLACAGVALAFVPLSHGNLVATLVLFSVATAGMKAYLPAFWCLPSLFVSGLAAAASAGFINSFGNLGGFVGSYVLGGWEARTGRFEGGVYFIAVCAALAAAGVLWVAAYPRPQAQRASDLRHRQVS